MQRNAVKFESTLNTDFISIGQKEIDCKQVRSRLLHYLYLHFYLQSFTSCLYLLMDLTRRTYSQTGIGITKFRGIQRKRQSCNASVSAD